MTIYQRQSARRSQIPVFLRLYLSVVTVAILACASLQAQTSPAAAASVPQPKPLLILKINGKTIAFKTRSANVSPGSLLVETIDGAAQSLDPTAFVNQLTWYTDAEMESGRVDLNALAIRYRAFAGLYPDAKAVLMAEAQRFTDIAARAKAASAQSAADIQKRVDDFLASNYDPAAGHTRDETAGLMREADELARLSPASAARVTQAAAPIRDALAKLDAGQTFFEGTWQSAAAVAKLRKDREEAAIHQTFDKTLSLPLPPDALGASQVLALLGLPAAVLLTLFITGLIMLAGKRRGQGLLVTAATVAAAIFGGSLLLQNNSGTLVIPLPDAAGTQEKSDRLVGLLYRASSIETLPPAAEHNVRFTNEDLSSFLARHVQHAKESGSSAGGLRRERLALGVTRDGFVLLERASAFGQAIYLRYDVKLDAAGSVPAVDSYTLHAGGLAVPDPAKSWLWAGLAPALSNYIASHRLLETYAVADMSHGEIKLTAVRSLKMIPSTTAEKPASTAATTAAATPLPVAEMPAASAPAATPAPPAFGSENPPDNTDTAALETPAPVIGADGQSPSPDNTFYMYAIWDQIAGADDKTTREQMDRLIEQFGHGNRFNRVGFAFIMPSNEARLIKISQIALEKKVALAVILGPQTHTDKGIIPKLMTDLRSVQWRLDGKSWRGYYTGENNAGSQEIGEDSRDHLVPSPSRYCKLVRDQLESYHANRCQILKRVMRAVPGAITCINGSIEEELAIGAASRKEDPDALLGDYSPFAVAEFRDWLCHTGEYDADKGKYAGDGAPESLVGKYVSINGKDRSPFYADPDPATSRNGGRSFNSAFGTKFTAWTLKYWDTKVFGGPITDEKFNPAPESGTGYTEGGFDAPRQRDNSNWWHAWSWDYYDRNKQYPAGNPQSPAFGFRQAMVHHFNEDMFRIALKAGLPANLMFAHQVPGEVVGDARCRSGASPVWTGFLPFNGTVGITRFGPIDPKMLLQYTKTVPDSRSWGIFEWHPMPNAKPDDAKLYQTAAHDLQVYYNNKCHHLFAGWWKLGPPPPKETFPLAESQFAKAIKDFMTSRPDRPYPGTVVAR